MKPNFEEMSFSDLRAYILTHREDDEAIRELFMNRRNPNAKSYTATCVEEMTEILRHKLNGTL